ncbi:adenylate kinase 8 isoform X5 [Passer montanus]|uniref:adenylate kinase 8 isoform X5 n=1 Tax=Passer montanus TaxID=9160 RepID=UPI001961554C|nr:adenylate kinase 8 isoform X5 [Passer montanus]
MAEDAARPWPPPAGAYAEERGLFQLLQNMLEELLIHKPDDPIEFMINHLKQNNDDAPRICVLGPPASGKTTVAMWLCKHFNAIRVSQETLLFKEVLMQTEEAKAYKERNQKIPNALWANLIQERLSNVDCIKQGWILEGFPENQEQAWLLQSSGIFPRHVVMLYAPDTVLIERSGGKRLDPLTQEVFHTTFDWPSDPQVQQRLVKPEDLSEQEVSRKLLEYHRNFPEIFHIYQKVLKSINADQPSVDVLSQVPDNLVLKLLTERLSALDCLSNGWVLSGFPRDVGQGEQLQKAQINPNRVFFFNLPYEAIMERLSQRRTDPVTGERYHTTFRPAPTPEIQARLRQNPKDEEENIEKRLDIYYSNVKALQDFYQDAFYVNADQDPYVIFEFIESCIIKPLPCKKH